MRVVLVLEFIGVESAGLGYKDDMFVPLLWASGICAKRQKV